MIDGFTRSPGERLRVAIISEHASPAALIGGEDAGGQNVYVDELSRILGRMGHAVDVFTRRDSLNAPDVLSWAENVRIVNLTAGPLRAMSKDDLWTYMPDFRDSLLRFVFGNGARYDVIHANFWMSGWVALELKRVLGVPVVQTFHALGTTKRKHQGSMDTSPPDRISVETEIVAGADRVIAQCLAEQDELVRDYRAHPSRMAIAPAGVNLERFSPVDQADARQRIGFHADEKLVVYVGRILPRKDIRNVVRSVALLKRDGGVRPRLLIVGGESERPDPAATPEIGELLKLTDALGAADVVDLVGKRQPDELRYYYGAADVVVTTPWYEPFGLTPLEAMACARPVIGSDVGGIRFTVCDGLTGFLVPPRDPESLAGRLRYMLDRPYLCTQMGRMGRGRVEREFSWARAAERVAEVYESVLAQNRAPADPLPLPGIYR